MKRGVAEHLKTWVMIALLLLLVGAVMWSQQPITHSHGPPSPQDELHNLATMMRGRGSGKMAGKWPPYSGKAFVLALVASGTMNPKHRRALRTLFAPGHVPTDFAALMDDYGRVTGETLKAGMDVRHLTSYAGRRNAEERYRLTQAAMDEGAVIMADLLSIRDHVIVAHADGGVVILTRKDLGLRPDDPIVVGDASKSSILRALSDQ